MGKSRLESRHTQILMIGAGGHALSVADAAVSSGMRVLGFYSPNGAAPAVPFDKVIPSLDNLDLSATSFALGIGANHAREDELATLLRRFPRARITSVLHASASISTSAIIGEGAVALALASVGPESTVGVGAVLNTGASLDHNSLLGEFASLGPGSRTGGNVQLGERAMVGMQASILQECFVGRDSVIGAHSLVNRNVEPNTVAWGTPAIAIRKRSREDHYL